MNNYRVTDLKNTIQSTHQGRASAGYVDKDYAIIFLLRKVPLWKYFYMEHRL